VRSSLQKGAIGLALLCAGMLVGGAMPLIRVAQAEIRTGAPPQAFQSGGQLSVPVLKEIATTLHQIDARLARLEALGQKMQTTRPVVPAKELSSGSDRR
jgi:hypothetical protein